MQYPDVGDPKYQPLYVGNAEAEGYARYARDLTAYFEQEAKARDLVVALVAHGTVRFGDPIDLDNLAHALGGEHRTRQQHVARVVRRILEALAVQDHDDRNEAAVRFAQGALAATEDVALPFI
jgi:hypothetical protein